MATNRIVVPRGTIRRHMQRAASLISPGAASSDPGAQVTAMEELARIPSFGPATGQAELTELIARAADSSRR